MTFKRRRSAQERQIWHQRQVAARKSAPEHYAPSRPAPGDWDTEDDL